MRYTSPCVVPLSGPVLQLMGRGGTRGRASLGHVYPRPRTAGWFAGAWAAVDGGAEAGSGPLSVARRARGASVAGVALRASRMASRQRGSEYIMVFSSAVEVGDYAGLFPAESPAEPLWPSSASNCS